VTGELLARGNDAVWLRLQAGGRAVRVRPFGLGLADTAFPFLLLVSQAETEAVLGERLAAGGGRVERSVELTGFTAGADRVACTLRHPDGRTEQVEARYLVGCDGAASSVRRGAGIPFRGGAYPQTFALADLEIDGDLETDSAYSFLGDESILFCFPLGRPTTWRLLAMHPGLEGRQGRDRPSLEELQALADPLTGGRLRFRDPVWLTYFRLQHRHAARYRAGRVLLAGDAAHVHSPAGAQGMNTGIQDAWNLGWKLALVARGLTDETLLDSYDAERRPVGRFVVRFTDRAFSVATSANPLVRTLRTRLVPRVLPLALRFDRGVAYGFRTVSQLGIAYRGSPAVQEGRPALRRGPRAGDRLPDARHPGRTALLAGAGTRRAPLPPAGLRSGWPLGRGPPGRPWPPPPRPAGRPPPDRPGRPRVLHDPGGRALALLGVGEDAHYLVRPDGHVGYRATGPDLDGLERYLARWLSGAPGPRA
jgi:2-polyprenyl-6-methoxyphenol hydroxylase-like FAD-dependent oxidoreductase